MKDMSTGGPCHVGQIIETYSGHSAVVSYTISDCLFRRSWAGMGLVEEGWCEGAESELLVDS